MSKQTKVQRDYAHIFTCSNKSLMEKIYKTLVTMNDDNRMTFEFKNPFNGTEFQIWCDGIRKNDLAFYQGVARGMYEYYLLTIGM